MDVKWTRNERGAGTGWVVWCESDFEGVEVGGLVQMGTRPRRGLFTGSIWRGKGNHVTRK